MWRSATIEGVLQDGGEPVKQCKDKRICFLFRTPTRYAAYLATRGIRRDEPG